MIGRPERVLLALACAALVSGACRQDMQDQPRLDPLEASEFFENGMASRTPPRGTVARGQLREDPLYYTGKTRAGAFVRELPVAVDRAILERGRERYQIYCSVCHDSVGTGRGMIVRRGFNQPPSFHEERLVAMPSGYFFDVISNGYGVMSGYRRQVPVEDRWAITAYLRVLQLSQSQDLEALPVELQRSFREGLEKQASAHGGDHGGGHGGDGHGGDGHGGDGHGKGDEGGHGGYGG